MLTLFRFLLPIGTVLVTATGASAMVCGKHDILIEALDRQYQERQRSLGLTGNGALIEVYASEEGTWTILLTTPDGAACILADGEAWEQTQPVGPAV